MNKDEKEIIENPLHVIKEKVVEEQSKTEDEPICISCILCYLICLPLSSLLGSN
jgi:hypothetical protein